MRFRRAFIYAFGKYAWVYPFLQLAVLVPGQWSRTDRDRDVVAYYEAAERIRGGVSMYDPHPPPGPHVADAWYYLYPPFLASGLSILPRMSFLTFVRIWTGVMLAAFWIYALCLSRLWLGRATLHGTLMAGAALGLTPGMMGAINMGQADVLVWAMLGLAFAFASLRSAGLAAAAMTKVTPIWVLAVAAAREPRKAIRGAVVAATAGVAIALIALGPGGFLNACLEWFRFVAPALSQGQFAARQTSLEIRPPLGLGAIRIPEIWPTNLSLSFAPIQGAVWAGWNFGAVELPAWARFYLFLAGLAAPLTAAYLLRGRPPIVQYSGALAAAVLFAPIFRPINVPILALPAVIALRHRRGRPDPIRERTGLEGAGPDQRGDATAAPVR